jgi:hypothetical protein
VAGVLPGLQYTDFHKFLVSIGGLFMAAGFALPIFLLRTQSSLLVPADQLAKATPGAAAAIQSQQEQIAILVAVWPWLSAGLSIIGLALIAVGARTWRKQQKRIEHREEAELSKIRAEGEKAQQETLALVKAQKATPDDLAEQVEAESAEIPDSSVKDSSGASPAVVTPRSSSTTTPNIEKRLGTREADFRAEVLERIADHFGAAMDLVTDVKLGPGTVADGIFVSRVAELPNLLVEVRSAPRPSEIAVRSLVQELAGWALSAVTKAEQRFGSGFIPVVVIIVGSGTDENLGRRVRQFRHIAADEAVTLSEYPRPLALLVTDAKNMSLSRLDAVPAISKGIQVM